jgi:hypothetical protein
MTTSELVFDPFSEEFFNGPWKMQRPASCSPTSSAEQT